MQFTTVLLATLAAVAQAMPAPFAAPEANANASANPEAEALATLHARQQTCTPQGRIIFYANPNYQGTGTNQLSLTWFQGQQSYCQLVQDNPKGGISFKSFISSDITVALYKSADCSGTGRVISQGAGASNPNVDESGYQSLYLVYVKSK